MEEKQTTGAMPASDMSGTSPTVSPMQNIVSSTGPASSPVSPQPGFAQPVAAMGDTSVTPPKKNGFLSLNPLLFTGIVVAGMGLAGVFAFMRPTPTSNDALSQQASSFAIQDVDLSDLATSGSLDLVTNQSLSVNGQLRTNNSLVITPTDVPLTGTAGQLYFDKSAAKFGYYDGTEFTLLAGSNELDGLRSQLQNIDTRVTAIPPAQSIPTDIATRGANNVFSSLNTFSSGISTSSLAVTGNGVLQGSLDVSGSTTLGATTISNLLLTSSLGVSSGGTGTSSLTANGVVIANGTGPLTTATYASGGQCLMSPASGSGAPVFGICPGGVGYGVNSLNGLMGDLVIANATASGATVTINDATGLRKGIASFDASNLTVTGGVVNTVQNISSTSSPTFAALTATTLTGNGAAVTNVNAAQLGGQAASYYLNATNISTGTLADARLSASVTLQGNTFNGAGQLVRLNGLGQLPALSGTLLTALNATNISTGTLADARLSANVALLGALTSNFTGTLQQSGNNVCNASNNCGYLTGAAADGSYIQLQATSPGIAQTGNLNITGTARAGTLYQGVNQVCDTSGNCAGAGGGLVGSGTTGTIAKFTGTGTLGNSIMTENLTTVTVGGTLSATTLTGNGAAVTNVNAAQLGGQAASYYLNATNISTGTLADARLSANVALLGALTSNFTGTLQQSGNNVCNASNNCGYLTGAAASGSYIQLQTTTPGTAQTGNLNISGTAIAANFTGGGANLTSLNASNVSSGTLADARLSANVALLGAASNTFTGNLVVQGSAGLTLGTGGTTPGKLVLTTPGLGSVALQSAAQSASITLNIPTNTNPTDTLCLQTLANCTGSGVSVSGTATDGRLTKFNAAGQIMNSNLSEALTTLTYGGNAIINAATGFTGNLIDVQLNGVSRFSVSHTGVGTITGLLGAYGGIDTNNKNISAGNGSITGALNSTAAILLNGIDINLGGTLTNVAYKDITNTFTQANTFSASVITPLLQSAAATALNLTGNAASMWSTTAGNVTIQAGSGTVSLGSSTSLISSSSLTVTSGGSLNLSSSGVNVANFDSETTGAVNIGANANAKAITVGNSTGTTSLTLQGGTGGVSIGTSGVANTLQIGNTVGAVAQTINIGTNATLSSTSTVTIGSLLGTSATTIQGGTGASALTLTSGAGGTISIGTTNTNTVTIGRAAGTVTLQGTVNAASGLYTGGTAAGNLRVSSTGALSNVSLGTSAGVLVAAPTTGALSVATTASSSLCLLSNGSAAAPSFQACPSGGGGWGLSGTAGTIVGTNYVGTSDNQAVMIKANGGALTPSYIQINSSAADSIGAITIAGNGPAGSSGGGTNWFDVKQAGGSSFFGISGSGTNARVQMYLQPGANIGASTRVCTSNAANTAGFGYMGACGSPADLAENYRSTQALAPGELVMADTISHLNVLKAEESLNGRLMGIVSTKPHEVMGQDEVPNGYPIALSGRVPTKVNGEGGPIAVGDMITVSSVPGIGKKATSAGMAVGTALNAFDGVGQGVIEVFVHLDYYEPSTLELLQANEARFGTLNISGAATVEHLAVHDATVTGALTVKGLATVQSINVKGHIITSSGQPTAQTMSANQGGAVEVDGTDTTGTITITTSATVSAGELAKIVFSELYGKAPRVMLTPSNDAAGGLGYFKGTTTTESFILNGKSLPLPNTTYKFDYFIAE